jgi:hypothetical protein
MSEQSYIQVKIAIPKEWEHNPDGYWVFLVMQLRQNNHKVLEGRIVSL